MNKITHTIELTLKDFTNSDFKAFITNLLTLQQELIKVDPEELDPGLIDFGMDQNMWDYATSAIDREPTEYDWEAAGYIASDLKEILDNLKQIAAE